MYNLEYFVYHLRPYGILSGLQDLNVHGARDSRSVTSQRNPWESASGKAQPEKVTLEKSKVVRIDQQAKVQTIPKDNQTREGVP